jgi:2'-5' RNA ligase
VRLFVAIYFSDAVRDAIDVALAHFPVADPPWRWSKPETWHITLKFIGDTPPGDVDAVVAALEESASRHDGFDLALGRFGAFPHLKNPRVLFYDVSVGLEPCALLAHDVDAALERATGLARESRKFHPHVTVARIKQRPPREVTDALTSVPALSPPPFRAASVDLMESRLGPGGARYAVVRRIPLR